MDVAESLNTIISDDTNLCLSGGADGADLQWGVQAGKRGDGVIHWSFQGHRSQAPEDEVVRLTAEQLSLADRALVRANRKIQRRFPTRSDLTNNLLRRNWYQVKDAGSLYAITQLENNSWAGGTAWAIQMYMDRFLEDGESLEKCKPYIFDKITRKWFTWDNWKQRWMPMLSRPPAPKGIWAGIGSRDISYLDRIEIRKLMGTYVMSDTVVHQLHPIIEQPKIGDIVYVPERKIPGKGVNNLAGGWATVRRINTSATDTFISVVEISDNTEYCWSDLQEDQIELRSKFKMTQAHCKPDFSSENNKIL